MWYLRELSLKKSRRSDAHIPEDMQIESFIHGAMCISYSGRCLADAISWWGRDANQGACTIRAVRKYSVVETRPGEYMPVYENGRGTYIFNSRICA